MNEAVAVANTPFNFNVSERCSLFSVTVSYKYIHGMFMSLFAKKLLGSDI